MKNYIAIDSGGTKVIAVLYDEYFHPKAISRVGSFRRNTTAAEQIRHNMKQLVKDLGLIPGTVIHQITGITTTEFISFLSVTCDVLKVDLIDELSAGLCAAEIFGDGIQTLSGTGANSAARYQEKIYFTGGYGSDVCDIGSGFWIGQQAMKAAIADFEGYGPKTVLTDLLSAHLGGHGDTLRDSIFSIYANDMTSISAQIAACSRVVSVAAGQGDPIALDILQSAGRLLAKQTIAMIRRYQIPDSVPLTISGSVWRSYHVLLDSFFEDIWEQCPDRTIKLPIFEPIIGVIIKHYHDINGDFSRETREYFKVLYPQYALDFLYAEKLLQQHK